MMLSVEVVTVSFSLNVIYPCALLFQTPIAKAKQLIGDEGIMFENMVR